MASATYLKTTQSARKGDKLDYDPNIVRHQQLLAKGFIELDEIETKPASSMETKPDAPKETKRKRKTKSEA